MSRQFIVGFVGGAVATASLAFGIAYASERSAAPKKDASTCRVTVGYGRMTAGDECYMDRVMTGKRGNYILCGDIQVTCN